MQAEMDFITKAQAEYFKKVDKAILEQVYELVKEGKLELQISGPELSSVGPTEYRLQGGVRLSVHQKLTPEPPTFLTLVEENELQRKLIGELNRKLDLLGRGIEAVYLDSIGLHKTT